MLAARSSHLIRGWPLALISLTLCAALVPRGAAASDQAAPGTDPQDVRLAQGPQQKAKASQGEQLQEVVITGSSLKQINAETALPVQVLSSEDVARSGAISVEELLQQIPAAASAGASVPAQATGFGGGAIATASLRGLGASRTLILIDGQRTSVYGPAGGSAVDIGDIPLDMIQRVEILKDGASSLYGSDAIAGVINFILKKDYQGAEVNIGGGTPTDKGGGQDEHLSFLGGLGDFQSDRYNATFGLSLQHQTALMGYDRSFATRYSPGYGNDVTSSFAFPANVAVPTASGGTEILNPQAPTCGPDSPADVNFPAQCRFDNSPFDSLTPEQTKVSATFNGHVAVSDTSEIYGLASFWDDQTTTTVQPVPLSYQNPLLPGNPYIAYLANLLATQYPGYTAVTPGEGAFLLPPSSPYYPTAFAAANGLAGQPLNLIYRDFASGERNTLDTAETLRLVGGYRGTVAGWDYDTSLLYSRVTFADDLQTGYALYSKIMPVLDEGNINPFGPTTDPAALQAVQAAAFAGVDLKTRTSLGSLQGKLSRDLLSLPDGPLSGAIGVELRRETYQTEPAAAIEGGDITGLGGNVLPESASRDVESAYIELHAPLLSSLDADLAGRFDNYQSVGSTTNPKLSLRWQPEPWVLLRGAAGTGFRAPSLTDLYAPQTRSVTSNGTRDPIKCPTFNADNPACSFQFTTITGGNPNLTPEKSQTYTLGLVLQPVSDLSVDFDSFWIFLKNQIVAGGLSYATILQNAQTATLFSSFITRDASGNIVSINQTAANLFRVNVSGLDIDLKYGIPLGPGKLQLDAFGTYFYRYDAQNYNGTWTNQLDVGLPTEFGDVGGVILRWRHTATLTYATSSFAVSLTDRFQKGYQDTLSTITGQPRTVSPYNLVDGQLSYLGLKSFKLTLGVKNIFNRSPPYANYAASANNFIGGYDLSYGDPLGRDVYASVTYSVK